MSKNILKDGDLAIFDLQFGPAVVFWAPIPIKGSGPATLKGKKICVKGDEDSVKMDSCPYTVPGYVAPGVGELKIQMLGPDQVCVKTKTGKKQILLKGGEFIAVLTVKTKATVVAVPQPEMDPVPMYMGKGRFITLNMTHKGT
jgi:hypothetical protein